jgi:anti-anti-sigma factor
MKVSELITREPSDHVTTLRLLGEWDLENAFELRGAAISVLCDKRDIIVDLSDVEFIDSSVINAVCKARSVAADERRECVLVVTPDSAAWQVLELTGLVLKVPTFGSEADAVMALAGAAA